MIREKMVGENLYSTDVEAALELWPERMAAASLLGVNVEPTLQGSDIGHGLCP